MTTDALTVYGVQSCWHMSLEWYSHWSYYYQVGWKPKREPCQSDSIM